MKKITVASFFSGAMGLDLGLELAGGETIYACEFDKSARETIQKNRPDLDVLKDIRDFNIKDFRKSTKNKAIDVVAGGPPCQAFSTAGKRKGFDDARGNVFLKFLEVIEEIGPNFFVIENVRGLLSTKFELDEGEFLRVGLPIELYGQAGSAVLYTAKRMEIAGYSVNYNLYNAANFGVPQKRERVVIIGSRLHDDIPFLEPTHHEFGEFNLPSWRTVQEAFEGINYDGDKWMEFSESTKGYMNLIPEGEYWKSLPLEIQKKAMGGSFHLQGGKTGFYRRLSFDKPSPTLVTSPSMPATLLAHPTELRPLSIREYARIQQFPDDWMIMGSTINVYKQIGNAVPVGLGHSIGNFIKKLILKVDITNIDGFKYSRYRMTSFKEMKSLVNVNLRMF